ncbi:hypothetical protein Tco_0092627 [Tanacetum coccineum]
MAGKGCALHHWCSLFLLDINLRAYHQGTVSHQKYFCELSYGFRHDSVPGKGVSSKRNPMDYQIPMLMVLFGIKDSFNLLEVAFEVGRGLITKFGIVHSYRLLEDCFNPYKAFLRKLNNHLGEIDFQFWSNDEVHPALLRSMQNQPLPP